MQEDEFSCRDFCISISTSVFLWGFTSQGKALPPKISEKASVVAKREKQIEQASSSKTHIFGVS